MTRKNRILLPLLALLLILCGGSTYRRITWYDVMYGADYYKMLADRQVYSTDPGIGTFIWGDVAEVSRHEDVIIYFYEGMVFHRDGRLLAYCPRWDHSLRGTQLPDAPPLFRTTLLEEDFSACTLGELIDRHMINGIFLHTMSEVGLKLLWVLEDGRALYLDCHTPESAPPLPENPTYAQQFAHTTIRYAEVLDFFAETRRTLWQQPGYEPVDIRNQYPHISLYPNGYNTCDLARAQKLAQQEASP